MYVKRPLSGIADTYNKEDLSSVFVWKQEQSQHRTVWYLIIKGFTVKLKERCVDLNVISTSERRPYKYFNLASDNMQNTVALLRLCSKGINI